jgi:para-nitrobenzyl esterase
MDPIVSVTQGEVRGREKDGVLSFKGIPYAAAPFGVHRFSAPAPAESWAGVRDVLEYGPTVPKPLYSGAMAGLLPDLEIPGLDCLNLNIWTPAADSARRPVLVWIHGGGFVCGSGSLNIYDGSKFARYGVVCVTINYRLGVDGFLLIEVPPVQRTVGPACSE